MIKRILIWITVIVGICVVLVIFSNIGRYEGETAEARYNEYEDAEARVKELEYQVSDYEDALQQANSNIKKAKGYSGSSYQDMENALYNLKTVSEP